MVVLALGVGGVCILMFASSLALRQARCRARLCRLGYGFRVRFSSAVALAVCLCSRRVLWGVSGEGVVWCFEGREGGCGLDEGFVCFEWSCGDLGFCLGPVKGWVRLGLLYGCVWCGCFDFRFIISLGWLCGVMGPLKGFIFVHLG